MIFRSGVLRNTGDGEDGLDSSCTEEERETKIEGVRFTLGLGQMTVKGEPLPEELTTNRTEVGASHHIYYKDISLLHVYSRYVVSDPLL